MKMENFHPLMEDLIKLIVKIEKQSTEEPRLWVDVDGGFWDEKTDTTGETFIEPCLEPLIDNYFEPYQLASLNLNVAVLAKSESVANAVSALLLMKMNGWRDKDVMDGFHFFKMMIPRDDKGQEVDLNDMTIYCHLQEQVVLKPFDLAPTITKIQEIIRDDEVYVHQVTRSISEIQLFTPTIRSLREIINYPSWKTYAISPKTMYDDVIRGVKKVE